MPPYISFGSLNYARKYCGYTIEVHINKQFISKFSLSELYPPVMRLDIIARVHILFYRAILV